MCVHACAAGLLLCRLVCACCVCVCGRACADCVVCVCVCCVFMCVLESSVDLGCIHTHTHICSRVFYVRIRVSVRHAMLCKYFCPCAYVSLCLCAYTQTNKHTHRHIIYIQVLTIYNVYRCRRIAMRSTPRDHGASPTSSRCSRHAFSLC